MTEVRTFSMFSSFLLVEGLGTWFALHRCVDIFEAILPFFDAHGIAAKDLLNFSSGFHLGILYNTGAQVVLSFRKQLKSNRRSLHLLTHRLLAIDTIYGWGKIHTFAWRSANNLTSGYLSYSICLRWKNEGPILFEHTSYTSTNYLWRKYVNQF